MTYIVGVAVGEKRGDGEQDLGDSKSRRPVVLQDIKANTTIGVNVAVVDLGSELDLRGSERIVRREEDGEEEETALIRRILRTDDRCTPLVEIVAADGASSDVLERLKRKEMREKGEMGYK